MPVNTPEAASRGLLYTATGPENHLRRAVTSFLSARHYAPNLPGAILTNHADREPLTIEGVGPEKKTFDLREVFNHVVQCKRHNVSHNQYMRDRLTNLLATPFERTLALDTDTYFLEDPSSIFDVLDGFDVVMCHGHNRERRLKKAKVAKQETGLPDAFCPLQGGLIAYRWSDNVRSYLEELLALYTVKGYFDDQISMRELLFRRKDIRLYILPYEYNFNCALDIKRWRDRDHREAVPRIFHYTAHKHNFRAVVDNYDPNKVVI